MQKRTIVIGGDKRFDYLRKMLCNNDCFPADYLIENLHNFDKVVLPYPLSFDGNTLNAPSVDGKLFLSDIISSLSPMQTLFLGGKLPEGLREKVNCKIKYYTSNEDFLCKNAELTAEGVLKTIIEELPISLRNTCVGIMGYGRVGSKTAELLTAVGCKVCVFERDEDKRYSVSGYSFSEFTTRASLLDCVVNTVPACVLDDTKIESLRKDCVLIETASAPYGIDFSSADRHGIKTVIAGSLPGKTSPKTAAEIIFAEISKEDSQ